MANPPLPTPPARATSFTDITTNNPAAQQPGDKLDAEYDRSNAAIAALIAFVQTLFQADGTLKPGTVGTTALTSDLAALMVQLDTARQVLTDRRSLQWAEYLAGPVVSKADAPAYIAASPYPNSLFSDPVQGGSGGMFSAKYWSLKAGAAADRADAAVVSAGGTVGGRTPVQRALDVINVRDYGAKGDGTTDDTAAINAAIAAAFVRGGATVYFPTGRYRCTAALVLTISGNVSICLVGDGRDVSEIVWDGGTDGVVVTLNGPSNWLRTPALPAPVFHYEGLSLVQGGASIAGTALKITAAPTAYGFSPQIAVRDIGIHGTANTMQGWHDGIDARGLASGMSINHAYMVFANPTLPPYVSVGNGIHIEGGSTVTAGHVRIASLFYFTDITIQNAHHGVDIGRGVQGVYMDKVGGNADWFIYASQPAGNGDTGSIALCNSNPTGYYGSFYSSAIDYIWLTNNQFQPFMSVNYNAVELHDGGMFFIDGNTFVGSAPRSGVWQGVYVDKPDDVMGSFNNRIISRNIFSLIDIGVQLSAPTKNTLVTGNAFNNIGTQPYIFGAGNAATNNLKDGVHELFNSSDQFARINGPGAIVAGALTANTLTTTGSATVGNALTVGTSLELGSQAGAGGSRYIDFHSCVAANTNDYDGRILSQGGTAGTVGAGSLAYTAAAHNFTGLITGLSGITSSTGTSLTSGGMFRQIGSRVTPVTGDSVTIPNGITRYMVDPAGTIAALTITMPAAPLDAQLVTIQFGQTVTALTLAANAGQTFRPSGTSLALSGSPAPGGAKSFYWAAAQSAWFPV